MNSSHVVDDRTDRKLPIRNADDTFLTPCVFAVYVDRKAEPSFAVRSANRAEAARLARIYCGNLPVRVRSVAL